MWFLKPQISFDIWTSYHSSVSSWWDHHTHMHRLPHLVVLLQQYILLCNSGVSSTLRSDLWLSIFSPWQLSTFLRAFSIATSELLHTHTRTNTQYLIWIYYKKYGETNVKNYFVGPGPPFIITHPIAGNLLACKYAHTHSKLIYFTLIPATYY